MGRRPGGYLKTEDQAMIACLAPYGHAASLLMLGCLVHQERINADCYVLSAPKKGKKCRLVSVLGACTIRDVTEDANGL
jgi:hypothetical protein